MTSVAKTLLIAVLPFIAATLSLAYCTWRNIGKRRSESQVLIGTYVILMLYGLAAAIWAWFEDEALIAVGMMAAVLCVAARQALYDFYLRLVDTTTIKRH